MISSVERPGWTKHQDAVMGPYWSEPLHPGEVGFSDADRTIEPRANSHARSAAGRRVDAAERVGGIRAGLRAGAGSGIMAPMTSSTAVRTPPRQAEPMTEPQSKFIRSLLSQRDPEAVRTIRESLNHSMANGGITKREASDAISALKAIPVASAGVPGAVGAPKPPVASPVVPAGSYAILVDGTVKFYTVKTPTEGKWAGYTFVEAHKSDDRIPVKNREHRNAILAQIAADPREAAVRFGHETNHCCLCNRELTDQASRDAGIGPVCAEKAGW